MNTTMFRACREELNNILMAKLAAGPKPAKAPFPRPQSAAARKGPQFVRAKFLPSAGSARKAATKGARSLPTPAFKKGLGLVGKGLKALR